jgi:hypothetical protein
MLVETPLSTREQLVESVASQLSLPACSRPKPTSASSEDEDSPSSSTRKVSVVATTSKIYEDVRFLGDPLALHMSSFPCDESLTNCAVTLVVPRKEATANINGLSAGEKDLSDGDEVITIVCEEDDWTVHQIDCSAGRSYSIPCKGVETTVTTRCPTRTVLPSCDFLHGSSPADSANNCKMVSYSDENVTCVCSLLPKLPFPSSGTSKDVRSRQLTSVGKANISSMSIPDGEFSISYVSMLVAVSDTFVSTVLSASKLNAQTIKKGWQALVTVGTLFVFFIVSILMAHYADEQVKNKVKAGEQQEKKTNLVSPGSSIAVEGQQGRSSMLSRLGSFASTKGSGIVPQSKMQKPGKEKSSYLQMADDALPQVLMSSKSLTNKVKDELKRHHRWLAVIFYFSRRFPRVLRIVSLGTNIVCMLFIQSLTYNLTNGDDGSCERLKTETACLEPSSPYSTGASKCYWTYENSAKGQCLFVQPDQDLTVIVFVAVFSAVVSTPIALLSDWIIQHVLSAPTAKFIRKQTQRHRKLIAPIKDEMHIEAINDIDSDAQVKMSSFSPVLPVSTPQKSVTQPPSNAKRRHVLAQWGLLMDKARLAHQRHYNGAKKDMAGLTHELKVYRQTLLDYPKDLAEFDCKF